MSATVLVGMSVADVDRRDDLLATARELGATVAFLQMADPSLSAELTRLADEGHETITLVGVSLGPLGPGQSWLSRIAAHWWRERAGRRPDVRVAKRLADDLADLPSETRPITSYEPGLTSDAWEQVSGHRHQVNICRGTRCTAKGATDNLRSMILSMMEHELGDDDVLLVHTGCQFPCNQAPVVSVQPDDVWYGGLDPAAAATIVTEHLVGGQPLASHRLNR
ncbi:MAG TPA: (2Fe-2S) ferredoxin domain-containing protein [Nocardioides sp.]|nr:(2Fe-2S) ferredoxin domain-containing protein [Nocardioides sp.]